MKKIMYLILASALIAAIAFCIGMKETPAADGLQLAPIYQARMVVPEIRTQAAKPNIKDNEFYEKLTQNLTSLMQNNTKDKNINKKEEKADEVVQKEETSGGTINAIITHYCAGSCCNGKYNYVQDGINYTQTASGILLHDGIAGNYCAATFGDLGDIISINGTDYKIVDRMGGNSGKRIDIFIAAGHEKCNELGRYTAEVTLKG